MWELKVNIQSGVQVLMWQFALWRKMFAAENTRGLDHDERVTSCQGHHQARPGRKPLPNDSRSHQFDINLLCFGSKLGKVSEYIQQVFTFQPDNFPDSSSPVNARWIWSRGLRPSVTRHNQAEYDTENHFTGVWKVLSPIMYLISVA